MYRCDREDPKATKMTRDQRGQNILSTGTMSEAIAPTAEWGAVVVASQHVPQVFIQGGFF